MKMWLSNEEDGPCFVVIKGKEPGVYMDWLEAGEQIIGVKDSLYVKAMSIQEGLDKYTRSFNHTQRLPVLHL
jgi:viroplasmin and RNaseH domain-containing protein